MKKKVLVIIPDRFEKATGGMGANSAPLFERLAGEYDFYVAGFPLAGDPPSFVQEYREVSSAFTEIKQGTVGTIAAQARYLAAAVAMPRPDMIYAFDWSIYHAAVEAAEFFKVPLVARMCLSPILLSQQGYTFGLSLSDPIHHAVHNALCEMEIRGLKRADRIVHVSQGYAKLYERVVDFRAKGRIVLNGIDLETWQDGTLESYSLPGENPIKVVFLGRFAEMKGVLPLVKARVPEGIDLIFIGDMAVADGICRAGIEAKVAKENNVYLLGPLYGADKIRALRSAYAVIVPSYHEPFGGVGLEGLAAGATVLSSRAGGLGDYLTDETSIACGTNPASIERAYSALLGLSSDARVRMREAGFATCRRLTLDSAAAHLKAVFDEVL